MEEVPGNWEWAKDGEAEEPVWSAGESEAGRKGARRSEKAKVPVSRGLGWRIHGSVEDTKLSTNKQHSISTVLTAVKKNKQPTHTPGGPGRLRSWSGPVETDFQGRPRPRLRVLDVCGFV